MEKLQVGQRWFADADAALGLGLLVEHNARQITLDFPAVGERRVYARADAPLTRAVFDRGDSIDTVDGRCHEITAFREVDGLLVYTNREGELIPESQLAATIQLNHPLKRLLAGQLDNPRWFYVRESLAQGLQSWKHSDLQGLIGSRINLTPHQLYVAHSATSRFPVRVLLADEVGLGKTIEAGLILQCLQYKDVVRRALILVPEALCVQWFVELIRCFSISSVLVNEDTEFNDSRVFIAPHEILVSQSLLDSETWDLLIVDEAHHFDLTEQSTEVENLRRLGETSTHCLLLTATPEHLGLARHFARLQLLDPDKFHSFGDFQKDYERYQILADDLQGLLDDQSRQTSSEQKQRLREHFGIDNLESSFSKNSLIELLLDSFGTGRIVYRNTRQSVGGFPKRQLLVHHLKARQQKTRWLSDFVKQHRREKILLITHEKDDVLALKQWLHRHAGVDCPVFHEDMTLVERDRAAAYFADTEEGAPLLLCSEIGSEGRNFQFCHRLICWDLPNHPDVLEQRIGRLDRIGQSQEIEIHVCIDDEESLQRLHWFHDILHCIERANPAAGAIHDQWYEKFRLAPALESQVKQSLAKLLSELEQGRNRLLEMNSCRQPEATDLVKSIEQQVSDNHPGKLLEYLADVLNLHYEPTSGPCFHLVPSDQMLVPTIPGIRAEGCEITFDRAIAMAREDLQFITWDHPLMQGLAEMLGTSKLGVASIALLPSSQLRPGMLFVEALFLMNIQSRELEKVEQYLSDSSLRVVVTSDKKTDLSSALSSEHLAKAVVQASQPICNALLKQGSKQILSLFNRAQSLAQEKMQSIIEASLNQLVQREKLEVARLRHLQQHNNSISETTVQQKAEDFARVRAALQQEVKLGISCVRVLVSDRRK